MWVIPVLGVVAVTVLAQYGLTEMNQGRNTSAPGPRLLTSATSPLSTEPPAPGAIRGVSPEAGAVATAGSDDLLRQIEAISSDQDAEALIGQQIELRVPAERLDHPVLIWIGQEQPVLVVLNRDTRTVEEREFGVPPSHGIRRVDTGEVVISGTVQPAPTDYHITWSWHLTRAQERELADRRVYIRAESVMPVGSGA
jgi:hypothetical protein